MEGGTAMAETELLERALGYTLCALRPVTLRTLNRPTPCRGWDLETLLWHTDDSLCALREGIEDGYVGVPPRAEAESDAQVRAQADAEAADAGTEAGAEPRAPGAGTAPATAGARRDSVPRPSLPPDGERHRRDDPAATVRATASRLLGAWVAARPDQVLSVADLPLTAAAVARAGALEIAVHGWDIARATGLPRPVPAALANELLRTARQLVPSPALRFPLFGPPLTVPAEADPSDRLVAFLGRDPAWNAGGRRRAPSRRPVPPPGEASGRPPLTP
ncbi:hypothetical protein GCM10012287_31730 [Streptomyces daqingensis]|uniref:TIGR03086 family protein n=2 Tax=Streptomyces daqingensis TaxID=1472640 RepID=A0ABQ2MFN3_9ACTN|nr:hypothetical protein GCM10012287_31730 [Streptomyces daqingensis]